MLAVPALVTVDLILVLVTLVLVREVLVLERRTRYISSLHTERGVTHAVPAVVDWEPRARVERRLLLEFSLSLV